MLGSKTLPLAATKCYLAAMLLPGAYSGGFLPKAFSDELLGREGNLGCKLDEVGYIKYKIKK